MGFAGDKYGTRTFDVVQRFQGRTEYDENRRHARPVDHSESPAIEAPADRAGAVSIGSLVMLGEKPDGPHIVTSGSVIAMENMENLANIHAEPELIPERDVLAMLGMLDYLIAEVGRVDPMSAQCLMVARKSLSETVADAFVKPN
jgi:hypothetical protein